MQVGITLPSFQPNASHVVVLAREAELAGIQGVFAFDHLWPGADKSRPALSVYPVLGAVAAATRDITIGTLVARFGLVADDFLIDSLVSLHEMSGHRLVAALGIGDAKSLSENQAFGIEWPSLEDRRRSLALALGELSALGIECWVGASSAETLKIARGAGVAVNLWDVELDELQAEAVKGPVTWAGPLPSEARSAASRLTDLRDAGANWAIWGWPRSVELVIEAMGLAGMSARGT